MKFIRIWFRRRWFRITRWAINVLQPYSVINWPSFNPRLARIRSWCIDQNEYSHKRLHDLECKCGIKLAERNP